MPSAATTTGATVIPSMRYKDAPAAIEWLCHALGFQKQVAYSNPDGTIAHAQLVFPALGGTGMVMLGSVDNGSISSKWMSQPSELGGHNTHGICLIVADADAVYATAKAANAKIAMEIADMDYGGRAFSCYDPEGHIWHIGTYNPWT